MTSPARVLIVDDSAFVRQVMTQIITSDPELEICGTASDPYQAVERMRHQVPDVILLDIEMPRMDGLTFLRKLMRQHPIPTVICSSITQDSSRAAMAALEAGAVDVICKPAIATRDSFEATSGRIREVLKAAARARISRRPRPKSPLAITAENMPPGTASGYVEPAAARVVVERQAPRPAPLPVAHTELGSGPRIQARPALRSGVSLIAIGASTGGTEAIRVVLQGLPQDVPAIVIVQHMPAGFTRSFAGRLDQLCPNLSVKEAEEGDQLARGQVLIAPGDRHMRVSRMRGRFQVQLDDTAPINRHRPSVDVLFDSVAECAGALAVGAILTGMGDDGARGLRRMRDTGAWTIAQDEATSVVYGMPGEAVRKEGAEIILPITSIAAEFLKRSQHGALAASG